MWTIRMATKWRSFAIADDLEHVRRPRDLAWLKPRPSQRGVTEAIDLDREIGMPKHLETAEELLAGA